MNQEIEIKIRISDDQLNLLQLWLDSNAKFLGKTDHKNCYLDNPNNTFQLKSSDGSERTLKFLRVRFSSDGDSVCFKNWHKDKKTNRTTHCDELETNVESGQTLLELFEALGYKKIDTVEKIRHTYEFKNFEIVIDDLVDLGVFVEIELKEQTNNIEEGRTKMFDLLKSIGITHFRLQIGSYKNLTKETIHTFGELISL